MDGHILINIFFQRKDKLLPRFRPENLFIKNPAVIFLFHAYDIHKRK